MTVKEDDMSAKKKKNQQDLSGAIISEHFSHRKCISPYVDPIFIISFKKAE